ncbi:MAG: hypothetical protein H7A23_18150 [Leptospiraceae bacterium]|nr:hypothetical protein [Leptospiraceae bacterium]MCP5496472.1 hypothetical protein [Leptospiraceae bacterium]
MDSKTRSELIREGNTAFNEGNYTKARDIYIKTNYKDGLIRLGDYYMYDKKLPMLAYGYYKKAGYQQKVDEIFQRMIWALSQLIGKEKFKAVSADMQSSEINPDDFKVHPVLRSKALEILNKNNAKN